MLKILNGEQALATVDHFNQTEVYLVNQLRENIDRLVTYREANPLRVGSNHLLANLMLSVNVPYPGDMLSYWLLVSTRAKEMHGTFGLTSQYSKGRVHTSGIFHSPSVLEAVVVEESPPEYLDKDWRTLRPVVALSHPRSDLSVETLSGRNRFTDKGYAVTSIDIPMLMCQRRMYEREIESYGDGSTPLEISAWLHSFPLTLAVESHIEVALLNRFSAYLLDRPFGKSLVAPTILQIPVTGGFDKWNTGLAERILKRRLTFEAYANLLPSVMNGQYESHRLSTETYRCSQNNWAYTLARLPYIELLVAISEMAGSYASEVYYRKIYRECHEMLNNGNLSVGLDQVTAGYLVSRVNELMAVVKEK